METAIPPRWSIRSQQASFVRVQRSYDEDRPREALGMLVPADVYNSSARSMPFTVREHEYPSDFEDRRVRRDGSMK